MLRRFFVLVCLGTASACAATGPFLFRDPALSKTTIVFSYSGDLWSVPRDGGQAVRLTTGIGIETSPYFSPDGSMIAFRGEYDGNKDVFVMPAKGGVPKRLTWHPGQDDAVGWTPDGNRVLFASDRSTANDGAKLFTVPVDGGFPEELPFPIALEGSYSPDGNHLAYVPLFQWQEAWKRYRGGQTRRIWMAALADSKVVPVPRDKNANDFNPMWVGDTVYFLSDRGGPVTLYSYNVETRQAKCLIENRGLDFKSASAGPGGIVYEQFGALYLYDFAKGQSKAVPIELAGDLPQVRPHFVNVAKNLRNADISPNGARAVFEVRGEILTLPAEKGDARNLTNSAGVQEREPAWSPDGKTIAYFSDEDGEYALHLRDQNGMGSVTKISLGPKPSFYSVPRWSPDSKKIAYLDAHAHIWYIDVDAKKPVLVDTDYYSSDRDHAPWWSPDSKWLAYAQQLKSHMTAIWLYSLSDGKKTQITDGMSEVKSPVFDQNGKYLYFTESTDSGSAMEFDLHALTRSVSRYIYVAVLPNNEPSPLAPQSDDEKIEQEKKENVKADEKKEAAQPVPVRIDLDNIGQRILALPMPARRYAGLEPGTAGVLLAMEESPRTANAPPTYTVHRFDMAKRRADVVIADVKSYRTAFKGTKYLYQQGEKWVIASLKPMPDSASMPPPAPPPSPEEGVLKTQDLEVRVDPRAEWKQMYREVWRIQREFFYDPGYHGLHLAAVQKRYEPYLENLGSREDLNYLFAEALGEMTVGHMFIRGGDNPEVKNVPTGLLGADYVIENGRYRFKRIYNGENWNPDLKAPLTQPGVNVAEGDYLLAVNGRDVDSSQEVYSYFEGLAEKATVLKVGPDPSGKGAREVTVVPVKDEHKLRNLAWIEGNRRKVDQMTGGHVAYIYMPDTAFNGLTSFNRYFFSQSDKQAVVIDERFNHGGMLASDIVEYLSRKPLAVATTRDGADQVFPLGGIYGPKVMVTNEFAGSGGDALPWLFRRASLGKLVGKRTWGGLVGIGTMPELMDGGRVTSPNFGIWNVSGVYDVENQGIAPDIEVELDPAAVRDGHDPQLEKAVEVVMTELKENPAPKLVRPAFPKYERIGN
ncbi:MAG TPA: PDZ domain-containing protein [Bryobacteraceae bacterium]|nr:PDZ domain-containing protein [Bryobacteraceae bacterium]